MIFMHHDEFAKILLSDERRKWQNADKVISQLEIKNYFQICDLGCGPGYFTLAFAKKVGKRNVELICSDVVSTGLPDATMDIAFFANVLHDIAEKREFLREVKRICKSQAKVVDVDWDKDKASEQGPPAYMRLSEDEALQLFEKEGFRLEKKIYGGEFHYGLLFSLK